MSKRRLTVFNQISLDGYFTDAKNDMSWAHRNQDAEWQEFTSANARSGGELLFGRITYEMMASFWPTPAAAKQLPDVAKGMNASPKVVFSRTLAKPAWQHTRVVKGDIAAEVRRMKAEAGPPMVLMGSGTIVAQLSAERLVDEYTLVVHPVVLGAGRTMFEGVGMSMKRTTLREFANGSTLLAYTPA